MGPDFLVQSLVCPMLGSHQLPGSRCAVVLLWQEWGWEESCLVGSFFGVQPWASFLPALRLLVVASGQKLIVWVFQVLTDSSLAWFSSLFFLNLFNKKVSVTCMLLVWQHLA